MTKKPSNSVTQAIKNSLPDLLDMLIFQENDGTYQLFNKYSIKKLSTNEFKVSSSSTDGTFYTLKNAVAWCTNDNRNRIRDTDRIAELDGKLSSIDIDITIHRKRFTKSKTTEEQLISIAKLDDAKRKRLIITEELFKYINETRRWQMGKFNQKSKQ